MLEWVQRIHSAFNVQSTAGFAWLMASLFALLFGAVGGLIGFVVDKSHRRNEERRLLEQQPGWVDPYVIREGRTPSFRIDTLDQDLRKVGVRFTSLSTPQLKPTPETDAVPMEYFQLKNGLLLRAQWRSGARMSESDRALAERVILAHEARIRVE